MVRGSSGPLPGESKGLATQLLVVPPGRFGASLPRLSSAYISHESARRRRLSAHTARWELPLLWARAETCRTAIKASKIGRASCRVREKAAESIGWPERSTREPRESREMFLIEDRVGGQ